MAACSSQEPLGLSLLKPLNRVNVRQKTTVFAGNKYVVTSPSGADILFAKEEESLMGLLSGKNRAFHIDLFDTQSKEVVKLRRPYTFGPDKMDVVVCGRLVCIVRQEPTFFKKVLSINDAGDRAVLRVKGPAMVSGECDFDVFTPDKRKMGVIRKCWGGFGREAFTDSDNYQIHFPSDLDVNFKAALIGTCFLIDFLYYEN